MISKLTWNRGAQLFVVLLSAFTLKQYYSTASVNQLRWILAPTTLMVELATGSRFKFESFAGYINHDRTFVIAASCAGVNFLIAAFLMLCLRKLWTGGQSAWKRIPAAALFAYLATLVANTIRIATAVQLQQTPFKISNWSGNEMHRFEGIFIYFGFLLLLFLVTENVDRKSNLDDGLPAKKVQQHSHSAHRFGLLRRSLVPLLVYYASTLGIPIANAALHRGPSASNFLEHSIFVLLTPIALLVPITIFSFYREWRS